MKRRMFALLLGHVCLFLAAGLGAQSAGVWFSGTGYEVANEFEGADSPYGVVAADFNGDGKLDLATATYLTNNVTIFLGNGNGALTTLAFFATGTTPKWIVAGDFNNDGKRDLATANLEVGTVSILLGNGDGTFGTNTDFITGANPAGIAVGDFNGDGIPDLVTGNAGGDNISVLLGQGGGVFATRLDFPTATRAVQVIVGDFNGDGKEDVAVAGPTSNPRVSILLGRGDGTFGAHTAFPTGSGLSSLAIGDFNGDGVLDLVTANNIDASASILLGKGDGTFDPKTDLATARAPRQVAAEDFNADGKLDFLTASEHGDGEVGRGGPLTLYLGNGDGTFGNQFRVGDGPYATGIAAVDFNADGRIDLAISDAPNDGVGIFLQSAHVTLDPAPLRFELQPPGTTSSPQIVTVQSTGSFAANINNVNLAGVDPDQFAITVDECSTVRMPSGSNCAIAVVFSPTTSGYKSASLVVNHDAPGSPESAALFASPADFTLAAACQSGNPPCNSNTMATITAGQSVSFTIIGTPTPVPHYPNPVTVDCIDLPSAASCTFTPRNTLDLNAGPQSITLTIKSTAPSAQLMPPFGEHTDTSVYAFWLGVPLMALFGLLWARRDRKNRRAVGFLTPFAVVLVMSSLLLACSDPVGVSPRPGTPPGTPPGTHTVIVTATAGSLQHSLNITVVVR